MTLARSFRLGLLSLGALLFLAPYIFMLSTAAKSQQDIFSSSLSLIPHNWALWDNLAKAMSRVVNDNWTPEKATDEMIARIKQVAG